jgi:arginyl-tRNA synthetase
MQSEELKAAIKEACRKLFNTAVEPEITRPDEKFGDYATNVALQLAKQAAATPRQIAEKLVAELQSLPQLAQVTIAGPGFINFKLTDETLAQAAFSATDLPKLDKDKEILVEFGDPNPFKEMHIGHLYSYIVGDSISSLLEAAGASVKRLSYHGDVGRHVAMAIYGLREISAEQKDEQDFLGKAYSFGHQKYESDPAAKAEIESINQHIYAQDDPTITKLNQKGAQLSFDHFNKILNMLSISTDKRYFESQTTPVGVKLVKDNIGQVFKESEGAVVYEGEKVGLHTRVFITSQNLPTYETKDLGLVVIKDRDFPNANQSIVITANEQAEYFKVMLAALAEIDPHLAQKTKHLSHGFLSLSTGKMSSRTGNVYTAQALLDGVKQAIDKKFPDSKVKDQVYVAATKYSMLKHRLGQDIVIDIDESVSIEGNSGPYLQYAYARACSILQKSQDASHERDSRLAALDPAERSLALKISEYPEVVAKAVHELMPHHICIYLYELAQTFNSFYEASRIIGDEREALRLNLVKSYRDVLKNGLKILNIEAPERM